MVCLPSVFSGYIYKLRTNPDPIQDDDQDLQCFCQTLECIFRKGLKRKMKKKIYHIYLLTKQRNLPALFVKTCKGQLGQFQEKS